MRTPLIIGNWKMNKTATEAQAFIHELHKQIPRAPRVEVVLVPPFTAMESAHRAIGASSWMNLGAQNVHWETHGSFTGEVSAAMLQNLGCRYVIIGHSDRRTLFAEGMEIIQKKVRAVLQHGLSPILCVGESLADRKGGHTKSVITAQLASALTDVTPQELTTMAIAYEPVWAIGTGQAASREQAVEVHRAIRLFIETQWNHAATLALRIVYGGSVTPQNIKMLLAADEIDGALIGGACLTPESFAMVISHAQPA